MVVRLALWVTIVAMAAVPAAADVAVEPGVPFTALELTTALAQRRALVGDVTVRALSRSAVVLWTPAGSQQVALGAARGPAAARLVALQLAPLSIEPALPAPFAQVTSAPGPEDYGWVIELTTGGGRGLEANDLRMLSVRADAIWAHGAWRFGGGVGWLHGSKTAYDYRPAPPTGAGGGSGSVTALEITADFAVVRGLAGFAIGPLEIVAGPEIVPYRIASSITGTTLGIGGSVRFPLFARARWQALASADLDAFQRRTTIAAGTEEIDTPRFSVTAALGVAWEGP